VTTQRVKVTAQSDNVTKQSCSAAFYGLKLPCRSCNETKASRFDSKQDITSWNSSHRNHSAAGFVRRQPVHSQKSFLRPRRKVLFKREQDVRSQRSCLAKEVLLKPVEIALESVGNGWTRA
jgi:hypothetical protein